MRLLSWFVKSSLWNETISTNEDSWVYDCGSGKIEVGPTGQGGKMTYRNTALVACLTVVLCGLSQVAAGATLCVAKNPSPGCPYSTIGAAVAAASAGDVVQVSQGTYNEDVVVGKAISL